jgi:two-component sensor histidine kinase
MCVYLESVCWHLIHPLSPHPEFIKLESEGAPAFLDISQSLSCDLLFNEPVLNGLKYAFPAGCPVIINVEVMAPDADSSICIGVADNGFGLPKDFEQRRSHLLGLQLISDLAGQSGGKQEISGNPRISLAFMPKIGSQLEQPYE